MASITPRRPHTANTSTSSPHREALLHNVLNFRKLANDRKQCLENVPTPPLTPQKPVAEHFVASDFGSSPRLQEQRQTKHITPGAGTYVLPDPPAVGHGQTFATSPRWHEAGSPTTMRTPSDVGPGTYNPNQTKFKTSPMLSFSKEKKALPVVLTSPNSLLHGAQYPTPGVGKYDVHEPASGPCITFPRASRDAAPHSLITDHLSEIPPFLSIDGISKKKGFTMPKAQRGKELIALNGVLVYRSSREKELGPPVAQYSSETLFTVAREAAKTCRKAIDYVPTPTVPRLSKDEGMPGPGTYINQDTRSGFRLGTWNRFMKEAAKRRSEKIASRQR